GLDQQAGTSRPTDPGTTIKRSTCLDRFDRFRIEDAVKVAQLRGERLPPPGDTERTMGALLRASLRLP
ncbi:hypothetical protein ACWGQ5_55635, partial [Streptomyces sp. NPDC055722]